MIYQKMLEAANKHLASGPSQTTWVIPASTRRTSTAQGEMRTAAQMAADIYSVYQFNPEEGKRLESQFNLLKMDSTSKYYDPYSKATNLGPLSTFQSYGFNIDQLDDNFFEEFKDLNKYYRLSVDGTPLSPTRKSSDQEVLAYAYWKAAQDEAPTKETEKQWADLQQEVAYWALRTDRNYTVDEILNKIDMSKYPALQKMDDGKKYGKPVTLNRPVGYSQDALRGVIWAARNGGGSGDFFQDAVQAELGWGKQYTPNLETRKRLDPTSDTYNPYLVGSTLDDEAAYFGVQSFDRDWLNRNADIMAGNDSQAIRGYQRVYSAVDKTEQTKAQLQDFNDNLDSVVRGVASFSRQFWNTRHLSSDQLSNALNTQEFQQIIDEAIEDYLSMNHGALNSLIDGIKRKQPVETTDALNFDYHGFRKKVEQAVWIENLRTTNPKAAALIEKREVIKNEGDAVQPDIVPKSKTNPGGDLTWYGKGVKTVVTWLMDAGGHEMPVYTPETPVNAPGDAGAALPPGTRRTASAGLSDASTGLQDYDAQIATLQKEWDALQPELWKTAKTWEDVQAQNNALMRSGEIEAEIAELKGKATEKATENKRDAEKAALQKELDALQTELLSKSRNREDAQGQDELLTQISNLEAQIAKLSAEPTEQESAKPTEQESTYQYPSIGISPTYDWEEHQRQNAIYADMRAKQKEEKKAAEDAKIEDALSKIPDDYTPKAGSNADIMIRMRQKYKFTGYIDLEKALSQRGWEVGLLKAFTDQDSIELDKLSELRDPTLFHMTDEELRRYDYLLQHNKSMAQPYLDKLKREHLGTDYREYQTAAWEEISERAPVFASLASLSSSFLSGAEGIKILADALFLDKDFEVDDPRLINLAITQTIRQTVPKNWGDAERWWYGIGMSVFDNLVNRFVLGPLSLVGAAGRSAAGKADYLMAQGVSSDQAQILSLLSGGYEAITENLDFGRFTAMLKAGGGTGAKQFIKGFLVNSLNSAFPEALEEGITFVADVVTDTWMRGEDSDLMRTYKMYLEEYKGDVNRAWDSVAMDYGTELGMDMLGGAVSGAFFGQIAAIGNAYNNWMNGKAADNTYQQMQNMPNIQSEDGQAQAAALVAQVANSYTGKQLQNPQVIAKLTPYQEVIARSMGFDNSNVAKMAAKVLETNNVRPEIAGIEAVKRLSDMKPDSQVKVVSQILNQNPSLEDVQTLSKLNLLKNIASPHAQNNEVDLMISQKMVTTATETISSVPVDTGILAFDQAIELPGMNADGLKYTFERWGQKGINYVTNLINSGDKLAQQAAAVLQSMPTYAESVIVAEDNMHNLTIDQESINRQLAAMAADMADDQIMNNTANRAVEQAVSIKREAILGEESPQMSQALEAARVKAEESTMALNEARQIAEAQAQRMQETLPIFLENPSDTQVMKIYQEALNTYSRARESVDRLIKNVQQDTDAYQAMQERAGSDFVQRSEAARTQAYAEIEQVWDERFKARQAEQQAAEAEQQAAQRANFEQINQIIEEAFADKSPEEQGQMRDRMIERQAYHLNQEEGSAQLDTELDPALEENVRSLEKQLTQAITDATTADEQLRQIYDQTLPDDRDGSIELQKARSAYNAALKHKQQTQKALIEARAKWLTPKDIREHTAAERAHALGWTQEQTDSVPSDNTATDAMLDHLLERYGMIPRGEKPKTDFVAPAKSGPDEHVSRFARTMGESGALTGERMDALKAATVAGHLSHLRQSNQSIMRHADSVISRGLEAAQLEWDSKYAGGDRLPSSQDMALGMALLLEYDKAGDTAKATKLMIDLADAGTQAGRAVQSMRVLKTLTDGNEVAMAQRQIEKINRQIAKRTNGKARPVEMNTTLAEQLYKAKGEAETNAALEAIYKDAAAQMPPSWADRITAWRYFSMLANPTTHIRNISGNMVFTPAVFIKNKIAATGESIFQKKIAEQGLDRTKSLKIKKEYKDFANEFVTTVQDQLSGEGKLNPMDAIRKHKKSFGDSAAGRAMQWLSDKNYKLLEAEDAWFKNAYYKGAFAGYLQANKVDLKSDIPVDILDRANTYAINEALKNTYQDASQLATSLQKFSNSNAVANLMVEGVLPFKKTPINLIKRGVEYSPIGLIDAMTRGYVQMKRGDINLTQFIDKVSSGLTGTGITALGFLAAALGWISAGFVKKDDERYGKLTGRGKYAFEIEAFGRKYSVPTDYLAPVSVPFILGATIFDIGKGMEGEEFDIRSIDWEKTYNILTSAIDPIFNLTVLDGVNQIFKTSGYEDNPTIAALQRVLFSYLSQFVPTVLGKVARVIDPVRRATFSRKDDGIPDVLEYQIESLQNRIPGLSLLNTPRINALGEQSDQSAIGTLIGNQFIGRILDQFIIPGYITEIKETDVLKMLKDISENVTDENLRNAIIPREPEKYFDYNSETYNMTDTQYQEYATIIGQTGLELLEKVIDDPRFATLDDNQRGYLVKDIYEYARDKGKAAIVGPDFRATGWKNTRPERIVDTLFAEREEGILTQYQKAFKAEFINAVDTQDFDAIEVCYEALMVHQQETNPGKKPSEHAKNIKNSFASEVKQQFLIAYANDDDRAMREVIDNWANAGMDFSKSISKWMQDYDKE